MIYHLFISTYPSIIDLPIISTIYVYLIIYQSVDTSIYVSICHPFLSTCISHLCLSNHLSINSSIDQSIYRPSLSLSRLSVYALPVPSLSLSISAPAPTAHGKRPLPRQPWRVKEHREEDPRREALCTVAVHGDAPAVTSRQGPSSDLPQDPGPQCPQERPVQLTPSLVAHRLADAWSAPLSSPQRSRSVQILVETRADPAVNPGVMSPPRPPRAPASYRDLGVENSSFQCFCY